jgi:arylsulfatase A-like enzyme
LLVLLLSISPLLLAATLPVGPLGAAAAMLLGVSLIVYATSSLHQRFTWSMAADHLGFLALLAAWTSGALQLPWIAARATMLLPLTSFLVIFFVGNKLCVRFFRDWVHHEMLLEWRVGAPIAGDAWRSLKAWDWIGGVSLPLGALVLTVMAKERPPAWSIGAWLLVAALAAFAHTRLRQRDFDPDEHNPLMNFLRGWLSELRRVSDEHAAAILPQALPPAMTGYRRSGDARYPLIQEPEPGLAAPAATLRSPDGKPVNVVLIVLESVRAYESGAYGANPSFTPEFDALAQQSLLIRNFYANGSQTARGELALLASHYDNFRGSPLYLRRPKINLRSLPAILRDQGYRTLWISSHTADYSNKRGFLTRHGIDEIFDDAHMPKDLPKINWGPPDEALFHHALGVMDQQREPFFAEIMTLTNHWPFEGPYPTSAQTPNLSGDKLYSDYTKGIYYTDYALGQFIREARGKAWFDRTLFVITSDHGAWVFPKDIPVHALRMHEAYFRMPLLFLAPRMLAPSVRDEVMSQVDVAPTLLDLLGLRARQSFVGRSLFDASPPEDRVALMLHWHTWNLRRGDRYLYNMGQAFTAGQHPSPRPNDRHDKGSGTYACFDDARDLLRVDDPEPLNHVGSAERQELRTSGENLLFLTGYLSERNRLYDQADTADSSNSRAASPTSG